MKTIAIIGGGFSGTLAAVNLARLADDPVRIVVINFGNPIGRGVAYGTKQIEHLLNVPAGNMSAFPDQPYHFVEWLSSCKEPNVAWAELREKFIPRKIYGDYLQSILFWHSKNPNHPRSSVEFVHGEVLELIPEADYVRIVVDQHPDIEADKMLLATGNQPPAYFSINGDEFDHPHFVANPWLPINYTQIDRNEKVVLLGAGHTMIDVFQTLSARDWQGTIYVVSRTNLLPQPHFQRFSYPDFPPPDLTSFGLTELVGIIEDHCKRLQSRGENPAIIVDKLRPFTQRIWQNFTVKEKVHFCRHYRTRWNVLRHRLAPSVHERLTSAIASGKLQLIKGRICDMVRVGRRIQVTVETSNSERFTVQAGWVINCTGPQDSFRRAKSALVQNLFDRGLVQADELDMGIKVGRDFSVLDSDGFTSNFMFAVGPMLKGSLWETTAVPELRVQALYVAEAILASLEKPYTVGRSTKKLFRRLDYTI